VGTPVLRITDGRTSVNLLGRSGFVLKDWTPQRPPLKDGGIWRDSPLASGRALALYRHGNIVDTFTLAARHVSQDDLIHQCLLADQLLLKALDYWQSPWQLEPVWLEAKGPDETNTRYALIHSYSFAHDDNPYAEPFCTAFCRAAMDELELIVEHGPWLSCPPGQADCLDIAAQQSCYVVNSWVDLGREAAGVCAAMSAGTGYLLQENGGRIVLENESGSLLLEGQRVRQGGVFVANYHAPGNLTHVYHWNGAAFSVNKKTLQLPSWFIFGETVSAGEYVAFGSCASDYRAAEPFCGLAFQLGTVNANLAVMWQYGTASGWQAFASEDITDNTRSLQGNGACSVHWRRPADWVQTTVNGATGYWVRALVTAGGTGPRQLERRIYAPAWPRVTVSPLRVQSGTRTLQLGGDLPALARLLVLCTSADEDTRLAFDRCTVGLRSLTRGGGAFSAYLACTDYPQMADVAVSLSAGGSFISTPRASTGRAASFSVAVGAEEHARFYLPSATYQAYRGTYHAYARAMVSAGSVRFQVRLGVRPAGTFRELWRSDWSEASDAEIAGWQLFDLGRVAIPPSPQADMYNDLEVWLAMVSANPEAGAQLVLSDLVLIPIDEWAGTFQAAIDGAEVGLDRLLDVDSVSDPRHFIMASNKYGGSEYVLAPYQPITNGPFILQANTEQALWFLFSRGREAPPEVAAAVAIMAVQRYQSMRGAR